MLNLRLFQINKIQVNPEFIQYFLGNLSFSVHIIHVMLITFENLFEKKEYLSSLDKKAPNKNII